MAFLTLIVLFVALVAAWVLYSNELTYKDRKRLIKEASEESSRLLENGDFSDRMKPFDKYNSVLYEEHLWYRCTFRNPMRLYT